jgi:hypothetical protein
MCSYDFRLSSWFTLDVDSALGPLHHVVGSDSDIWRHVVLPASSGLKRVGWTLGNICCHWFCGAFGGPKKGVFGKLSLSSVPFVPVWAPPSTLSPHGFVVPESVCICRHSPIILTCTGSTAHITWCKDPRTDSMLAEPRDHSPETLGQVKSGCRSHKSHFW